MTNEFARDEYFKELEEPRKCIADDWIGNVPCGYCDSLQEHCWRHSICGTCDTIDVNGGLDKDNWWQCRKCSREERYGREP